ncbi:DUF1853 family protein [Halomonas daqiaonensis]|uniref:DUF1853 domain-containing protein n=1 Tax=Halomonas daqiaonensis TaxID=650850 RepID=A0A1H7F9P6_9GAMM|nr:DUF1853 family protein [Halomonas daqiaonensis]SEK19925.1 hypothetical protein SAMN04488129_1018 [Halomonas daqiaonensis]
MTLAGSGLLEHCHHPLVRDLAWILLAPDLIEIPCSGRPSRGELGLEDDDRLAAWLNALEAAPGALEAHLTPALKGRMGLYHERLWQFLLDEALGTRLLGHNLRIHQGKRTLGELDLLYCRRDDPNPVHLEVAIKFYLGLPQGPGAPNSQARWIGPGGADSLAAKREHLHRHQLRLASSPEARETLMQLLSPHWPAERDCPAPTMAVRLAIPGVLFYPWHAPMPAPREATLGHLSGHWLYARDWYRMRDGLPRGTSGAWLHKPHWLALPRRETLLGVRDLEARLAQHFTELAFPVQLALWHIDMGWRRVFVVADDWPRQIPLPPRP